jgi:hypothetical protein
MTLKMRARARWLAPSLAYDITYMGDILIEEACAGTVCGAPVCTLWGSLAMALSTGIMLNFSHRCYLFIHAQSRARVRAEVVRLLRGQRT